MTFATLPPVGYTTASIERGAYGYQLNEKATSRVAHSKIINASRRPTAGNISNVFGVSRSASFVLLASKITYLLMQRNNQTAQMALTCSTIFKSYTNKGSDFSLAASQKRVYNMNLETFINTKRRLLDTVRRVVAITS